MDLLDFDYGKSAFERRLQEAEERRRINRLLKASGDNENWFSALLRRLSGFSFGRSRRQTLQPCEEC